MSDRNDERWQNLMTQSGAFVTAAADARAKGDREGAAHWEYMATTSLDQAADVRSDRRRSK